MAGVFATGKSSLLKRIIPTLVGILIWLCCLSPLAHAGQPEKNTNPIEIGEMDQEDLIHLRIGQALVIYLKSNPSTGFTWSIRSEEKLLSGLSEQPAYRAPDGKTGLMGQGGTEIFHLVARGCGVSRLVFEYRRPFEKDRPAARTARFEVRIDDDSCPK